MAANPAADRIYEEVEHIRRHDAATGYATLRFIEGWTTPLMLTEEVVRDDPEAGIIGWGKPMHPDTAPDEWVEWLAQFTGTKLLLGEDVETKRRRIKGMEGLRRGSPQALTSAVRQTLSDPENDTVYILERSEGSAWKLGVTTLISQTPDPDATERAAWSQTPAGIILGVQQITGDNSYTTLKFTHVSYAKIKETFDDYVEIKTDSDKQ